MPRKTNKGMSKEFAKAKPLRKKKPKQKGSDIMSGYSKKPNEKIPAESIKRDSPKVEVKTGKDLRSPK